MKAVMISIRPEWCEKILIGKKTIEIRKTKPQLMPPFAVYVYCTKAPKGWPNLGTGQQLDGHVIAEFTCDNIAEIYIFMSEPKKFKPLAVYGTGMTDRDIIGYLGNGKTGYGWHISNLKVYDKPKELSEFQVFDTQKNNSCQYRKRVYQNPDFNNGGFLYGSYYCEAKDDWCCNCNKKPIKRPPQSWCYVEEMEAKEDG